MLSELNANIEDAQCLIITVKDSESNVKKILEKSKNGAFRCLNHLFQSI